MRKLLLGAAAISLSGCSFLGIGGHSSYNAGPAYGGYYAAAPTSKCGVTVKKHRPAPSGCISRWNLEGGIGASFNVGGDAVTGSDGTVAASAVRDVDFDEAYDTGQRAELGLSYALAPDTKVTAMGFIDEADSAGVFNWGTVNGGQVMTGALSDYRSTGVELGLRKYFRPTAAPIVRSVRPYVEGRVGAAYQDGIAIQNATIGGVAVGAPIAFQDSGWVPSAAGLVGLETPLTRYSTIGLETGIRYTGGGDANTTSINVANGLAGVNQGGERISVPLMLRGRYRF
ncbi:hypothetical protein ACFFUB_01390 [Algimonas porphyrae]|uniref:hypothetical protein n=1 Tax=Algimonas porphyrae TaxID=1128113 RepID=UPI0024E0FE2E|nr:hypothetical protein [Algimonas porphyrae]